MVVRLPAPRVAEAAVFARCAASRNSGAYGDNSYARHFTGRLGELGAYEWLNLRTPNAKPLYRYDTRKADADITACGWSLEVKAWRAASWARLGPSLAPIQIPRIAQKADVVLACVVPDDARPSEITIVGWASVSTLLAAARPMWRGPVRGDLVFEADCLRPALELIDELECGAPMRTPAYPTVGPCGHRTVAGHCWVCVTAVEQPAVVTVTDSATKIFHRQSYADVRSAHNTAVPFAWTTTLARIPIGEAILEASPCEYCFPPQHR